jgi:hypothetical protein
MVPKSARNSWTPSCSCVSSASVGSLIRALEAAALELHLRDPSSSVARKNSGPHPETRRARAVGVSPRPGGVEFLDVARGRARSMRLLNVPRTPRS